jgi:hypothetical protein
VGEIASSLEVVSAECSSLCITIFEAAVSRIAGRFLPLSAPTLASMACRVDWFNSWSFISDNATGFWSF